MMHMLFAFGGETGSDKWVRFKAGTAAGVWVSFLGGCIRIAVASGHFVCPYQ